MLIITEELHPPEYLVQPGLVAAVAAAVAAAAVGSGKQRGFIAQ